MFRDLVLRNRSYRRFDEATRLSFETLHELVDLARQTPSARNIQPLKYLLVSTPEACQQVFPLLGWAGYLPEWGGPQAGERPAAYVVIVGDKNITDHFSMDPGIAAQTLLLGAVDKGLGGCIIGSVQRDKLASVLDIPERFEILYVVALGKPVESVVIDTIEGDGDIKYWRDAQRVHHVPKRALKDLIIAEK